MEKKSTGDQNRKLKEQKDFYSNCRVLRVICFYQWLHRRASVLENTCEKNFAMYYVNNNLGETISVFTELV